MNFIIEIWHKDTFYGYATGDIKIDKEYAKIYNDENVDKEIELYHHYRRLILRSYGVDKFDPTIIKKKI